MSSEELAFEIDFHPVGDGSKGGDGITLRYGRLNSLYNFYQKVVVIDGGSLESGKKIVEHIQKVYSSDRVDLMINTHPDNDHCSGLREIINNLDVGEIWMHRPWSYSEEFLDLIRDGRTTDNSLKKKLKDALTIVCELESIASDKNIDIIEPFTGLSFDDGVITVLGPTEDYYKSLLAGFRCMPEQKETSLLEKAFSIIKDTITLVAESFHIETLDESGETSSENNSSVITLFRFDNKKVLFTGDAGIPALKNVIEVADYNNISLNDLCILQIPHHGSKRNISPSILNRIKGEVAYISCPKEGDPKHPAKKVTNALIRRGMTSYLTKGNILYRHHNTPFRAGYVAATSVPFYNEVEE